MRMDLETHVFEGSAGYMTVSGLKSVEISFNLILNPESDERQLNNAAKALSAFLMEEYRPIPDLDDDCYN